MSENRTAAARATPWALATLVAVVAVVTTGLFLRALSFVIGWTWILLIGGTLAALVFVVLAVSRRRPVPVTPPHH